MQQATGVLAFDRLRVTRTVRLDGDGRLRLIDGWSGEGNRQTRLLIPAEWRIVAEGEALLLSRDGHRLRLSVEGADIEIGKASWSRYYDVLEDAHEILLRPRAGGSEVVTSFVPV